MSLSLSNLETKMGGPGGTAHELLSGYCRLSEPVHQAYAASSTASATGPESWPLADGSRSTNSITATGALSP